MENEEKKVHEKKFYNRWWFWVLAVFVFLVILGSLGEQPTTQIQSTESDTEISTSTVKETAVSQEQNIPAEYRSALFKADSYANTMHMSKKGVYDQLVSEYGEKFTPEAARYGVENVNADWKANALAKAKSYQDTMHMSPAAIHDQLTSDFGEKFTQEEADYAIQHLND